MILRSALVQMACEYAKQANVEKAVHMVDQAAAAGAKLTQVLELDPQFPTAQEIRGVLARR
jgi:predicted amidohydrolase